MSTGRAERPGVRAESARATRRRIVDAATSLLLAEGYHDVSVAALAKAAGVSPQTVYNAIGGKAEVLKLAYDTLLAGDDAPIPMSERPEFRAIAQAPDRRGLLVAYAALCGLIYGRVGSLLGAVLAQGPGADAGLARFVEAIEAERRTGNANVIRLLDSVHGTPETPCSGAFLDEMWTLTAPEVYDRLVRRCGWTHDSYVGWLGQVLVAADARHSGHRGE